MKWEGFSDWPPAWAGSRGREDIFSGDEDGVLTGVEMVEADRSPLPNFQMEAPRENLRSCSSL
jgi:hypothetical protein